MKTLIEIHALQNFAPSNLNRDDTGAPKDGSVWWNTSRPHFQPMSQEGNTWLFQGKGGDKGFSPDDLAIRTKRVLDSLVEALVAKGRNETEAEAKARLALAAVELKIKEDGKSEYLLFLGQREVAGVADIINTKWDSIVASEPAPSEGKRAGKAKKQAAQNADPGLKDALSALFNGGKAVDIALFGRMLADMPEKNQDAACQVANAISTHSVEREFDFYTAVDDLKPEDTAGADMMGTIEFNSACFYRYALVDWEKLVANLQSDKALAAKGLRVFLEGFVVAEPTGKQTTFAAHNPPEFVAVSVRRNTAPRSFTNAFEKAIRVGKEQSLTQQSVEALIQKSKALQDAYGGESATFVLNLTGAVTDGFGKPVPSLQELLDRVLSTVQE